MPAPRSPRRVRIAVAISAVLAAGTGMLAAPAPAVAAATAVVTGVVIGSDGSALRNVTVQARSPRTPEDPFVVATAVSRADGSYRLAVPLTDGVDEFFVDTVADRATGGTSATGYADTCARTGATDGCTVLQPAAGTTTRGVDLVLPRAAEVVGRLTDVHGRGVGRVGVYPWRGDCRDQFAPPPAQSGVFSDVNGNYRIPRLPAGTTTVCVGSPFQPDTGGPAVDGYDPTSTTLTLRAGRVTRFDTTVVAGGGMAGRVVDQFGSPVAGATVDVFTEQANPRASTAADGTFRVARVATGRHPWCVSADRYASTCSSDATRVSIVSERTARVGTVVLQRLS